MSNTVECPVCGKEVVEEKAPATAEYDAQTYSFCSVEHRDAFLESPGRYVGNTGS